MTESRGTPTTVASGQSRKAWEVGIAERTPYARVSYDAEVTTPRPDGAPPTIRSGAPPSALRVFETSDLDEERVAVDEQNPSGWW